MKPWARPRCTISTRSKELTPKGKRSQPVYVKRMAARRRKPLVVCRACHEAIQAGLPGGRTRTRALESQLPGNWGTAGSDGPRKRSGPPGTSPTAYYVMFGSLRSRRGVPPGYPTTSVAYRALTWASTRGNFVQILPYLLCSFGDLDHAKDVDF